MIVNEQIVVNTLLVAFDLGGTYVFAISGATAGVKHRLDLFGVLVLSFAAGNSGGIARDVMIGAYPPAAISDWRYIAVSMLAGLITFYWFPIINRLSSPALVFDAAGLALFAVAGAGKALAFHAGPVAATLLGMLTGIGGGMVRDISGDGNTQRVANRALRSRGADRCRCDGTRKNAASPHFRGGDYRRSPLLWTAICCHATRLAAPHSTPTAKGLTGNQSKTTVSLAF